MVVLVLFVVVVVVAVAVIVVIRVSSHHGLRFMYSLCVCGAIAICMSLPCRIVECFFVW